MKTYDDFLKTKFNYANLSRSILHNSRKILKKQYRNATDFLENRPATMWNNRLTK